MSEKDVWGLLFERGNAMQSFWGFYISVAFGIIAFFGSSRRSHLLAILIAVAFVFFAFVNCSGMYAIARQRIALFQALTSRPVTQGTEIGAGTLPSLSLETNKELLSASEPPNPKGVVAFHVLVDAGVLLGIWLLSRAA